MGSGLDRTQILRIDCPTCKGHGYIRDSMMVESICGACEGKGALEREMPYKFETNGKWEKEEIAEAFEIPVEEVKDGGHSTGD